MRSTGFSPLDRAQEWTAGFGIGCQCGFVDNVDLKDDGDLSSSSASRTSTRFRSVPRPPSCLTASLATSRSASHPNNRTPISHQPGDTVPPEIGTAWLQVLPLARNSLSVTAQAILGGFRTQLIDSGGCRAATNDGDNESVASQLSAVVAVQSRQLDLTMGRCAVAHRIHRFDQGRFRVTALQHASANFGRSSLSSKTTSTNLNAMLAKVEACQGSAREVVNDESVHEHAVARFARGTA